MKATSIVIIAVVALAMVFIAGCTSAPTYDNPDAAAVALKAKQADAANAAAILAAKAKAAELDNPYIFSHATTSEGRRIEVTGIIYNPTDSTKKVFGYVDYYQHGVKIDDGIFSCTPDAHGKATFKSSTYDSDGGKYEYKIRITNVYRA